jgi:hypothetical protein
MRSNSPAISSPERDSRREGSPRPSARIAGGERNGGHERAREGGGDQRRQAAAAVGEADHRNSGERKPDRADERKGEKEPERDRGERRRERDLHPSVRAGRLRAVPRLVTCRHAAEDGKGKNGKRKTETRIRFRFASRFPFPDS